MQMACFYNIRSIKRLVTNETLGKLKHRAWHVACVSTWLGEATSRRKPLVNVDWLILHDSGKLFDVYTLPGMILLSQHSPVACAAHALKGAFASRVCP